MTGTIPSKTSPKESGRYRWARQLALTPRWFLWIAFTALLAFAAKTTMAVLTIGTNDITTFQRDLKKLDAEGWQALYRDGVDEVSLSGEAYPRGQVFTHPPLMIRVLPFWRLLARITGLPFQFWLRLSCAMADVGSLFLLCLFRARIPALRIAPAALLVFAASPVLIMISGFHGNTDPILVFFILLAIYSLEVREQPALSGGILALAMGIKIIALIFAPAILFFVPTLRGKVRFAAGMLTAFLLSAYPFIFQNPFLIVRQLAAYNSGKHLWGWSMLGALLENHPSYQWLPYAFAHYAKPGLLVMMTVLPILMNWRKRRWPLLAQCGLLAFFFLFFTPGFGVQYLAWLAPWPVLLGTSAITVFSVASGAFLATVYTHWCRGLPWRYANAFEISGWSKPGLALGFVCWIATGAMLLLFADAWLQWNAQPAIKLAEQPAEYPKKQPVLLQG